MAIQQYDNFVIENKITDIMNSKLDVRGLMTIDTELETNAGMTKKVHKYTYTGYVEQLDKGAKNSQKGEVGLTSKDYTVKRYQQTYEYNDMDIMNDPFVADVLADGAAKTMANEVRAEYFTELEGISNLVTVSALDYDAIVDAIATLGDVERDTDELFIIMGVDGRQAIRKDEMFEASKQGEILYTGQFGTIAGMPCVFSKLVPAGTCYITEKAAVKFFVKREGSVEQDRDIESKDNTVVYERHGLIALVDDTHSVIVDFGNARFKISFNAGAGTVSPAWKLTGTDGKLAALPTPVAPEGKVFDKWSTAATAGTEVTTSTVFSADATIYAQYTDAE